MISLEEAKRTPKFSLQGLELPAIITKVYDGDTIHAVFTVDGNKYARWSCRLADIDTPELRSTHLEQWRLARVAKQALTDKILDQLVRIRIGKFDKYGRLLVTIYIGEENVNEWLVTEGYARPYF